MIWKIPIWLFWIIIYLFYRPRTFQGKISRILRRRSPSIWWTFTPHLARNVDWPAWEIRLAEDRCLSYVRWMQVDVDVSVDTGKVVGLTIKDKDLEAMESLTDHGKKH